MGRVYKAVCGCGYVRSGITAGCGLGMENEAMIKKGVPDDVYDSFDNERMNGNVEKYALGNAVTVCRNCREINVVSRFYYKLKESDEEFVYIGSCPTCGQSQEEADISKGLFCPKCNEKMELSVTGLWD